MSKSGIFLRILLFFIAGVFVKSFVPIPFFWMWLGLLSGVVFVSWALLRQSKTTLFYAFLIISFFGGVLRVGLAESLSGRHAYVSDSAVMMRGVVWNEPEMGEKSARLKIKIGSITGRREISPFFILATVRKYPEYKLGDELTLEGKLEKPPETGEFNYADYLAGQDIFSVTYFPRVGKTGKGKINRLRLALFQIKNSFEEKISQALPEPHAAFLKGLLLGEKKALPADLTEDFKKTGTTHIIALSGYNITLVGRFFVDILSVLSIPFSASFWLAALGIIFFVMLTGGSASLIRAAIMGILALVARREGRFYNMANALIFAGAVMIMQNPRILRFDAAFQLSFLATMGLMYLSPRVDRFLDKVIFRIKNKIFAEEERISPQYEEKKITAKKGFDLKKTLVETISAQLMVLPLLILLFGRVSIISPLSNILVLAAVPYAMGLGFLTGASGFISSYVSRTLGWPTWILLAYQIGVIRILAKIPYASLEFGKSSAAIAALLCLLIFFYFWRKRVKTAESSP